MRKQSLILIFIILNINAFAQKKVSLPFSSFHNEHALLSVGVQYNYVYQNFQLELKNNWQQNFPIDYSPDNILYLGNLKSIRSKSGSGFSVGIPIDLRINKNIYLGASPSFLFVNNLGIEYKSLDTSLDPLIRKSKHKLTNTNGDNFSAFETPINIKIRSDEKVLKNKFDRYRVYFTTGIRYHRWIGINKEYKNNMSDNIAIDPLIFKSYYLSWETGIGAELYFNNFKVSPEVKFNQSFDSVLDSKSELSKNNKFMAPIERALIRNIYFGLIFQ